MSDSLNQSDAVWKLAEFCAREAFLLRSFLEYLRTHSDPLDTKLERLSHWREEIGIQLGNPMVEDYAAKAFESVKGQRPERVEEILRLALDQAHSEYWRPQSGS